MPLSALPVVTRHCPDCPETRLGVQDDLVMGPHGCTLETRKVAAKGLLPKTWGDRYAFAMVRRGVVIRQRPKGVREQVSESV